MQTMDDRSIVCGRREYAPSYYSTLPTFKLEPLRASRSIIYRGEKRALIILHTRKSTELAREPRRSMCAATVTARSRRSPVCTYGRGGAPGIPRPCARAAIPTLGEFGPPPRARVYNLTLRKKTIFTAESLGKSFSVLTGAYWLHSILWVERIVRVHCGVVK
jgi:hypothetical protein